MELIKTNGQKNLSQIPTKLDVLREMNKRKGLEQDKKLKGEHERLKKGLEGEKNLVKYLSEYGASNWVILRNVWLEYFGEFEIDLLLITNVGLYAFEVKNYTGKLELLNSQCLLNGKMIGQNPFTQTQKVMVHLKEIFKAQPNRIEVQGVLTFISENNSVHIHDNLSGIQVLCRNELMNYIRQITYQERNYLGYPINIKRVLSTINQYEIGKPSKEKEIPLHLKENVQKGIHCCHCGSFSLKVSGMHMVCSCGMHEPKEEAIVRTICEYGVLHHEKNLKTTDLTKFFNGFITSKTVNRYLNKHFERIGTYRNTEFVNKRLEFEEIFDEFKLKGGKYLKIR